MKKVLSMMILSLLLVGCSSNETKQSEAVEQVFNTEVIEHTTDVSLPTSTAEESDSSSGLGSIVLNQFETTNESETATDNISLEETEPEVSIQDRTDSIDETVEVSSDIEGSSVAESKQIELNGRIAIKVENNIWTYELEDNDSLLKEDSLSDVSFNFVLESRTQQYPGTIEAVKEYANDIKEMIILFYRQATFSKAKQLVYKQVGTKEFTPDLYKEWMDIYEEGKQRMRVEINWDKLNNKPITISMSMIEGTEGEVIEDSQER